MTRNNVVDKAALAIEGGTPVRNAPLPRSFPGALMIGAEERQGVLDVIDSRSLYRYYGPDPQYKVVKFEKAFAETTGTKHALAVSSGTAAIVVAMRALGVGPGDEVIVPANTFLASVTAIVACQAVPVFAEIDDSLMLDAADVERRITPHTKAILPVHFGGVATDMDRLMEVARKHDLLVCEDCAQAAGAKYRGRRVGSIGHIGAFSLQLNKIITCGDGGVVTTNDGTLHDRAVRLHDQGNIRDADGELRLDASGEAFCGENYRMSDLQGAVALAQTGKLDDIIARMRERKAPVLHALQELPGVEPRRLPDADGDASATVAFFCRSAETAKKVAQALTAENVQASVPYGGRPVYAHPQILNKRTYHPAFSPWASPYYKGNAEYAMGMCAASEDLIARAVVLQINPLYTDRDVQDIVAALEKVVPALA